MGRITIKDVAREAGVSVGSVSRVLNGLSVSERLQHKVLAAIGKLGYEPNGLAQSMRTQSTGAIGCLVPDISNPLYAAIVNAIDLRLRREGYMLLLASGADKGMSELDALAQFKRRRVDGLIMSPGSETNPQLLDALERFGAPIVILDRDLPRNFPAIKTDYRAGVQAATRYLIDLGHRRIALLTPLADLWPGRERIQGFHAAYAEAGLNPSDAIVRPQATSLNAASDVAQLLEGDEAPTALIVLGTRILAGTLRVVRERNIQIPRDLSIISVGDIEWTAVHNPAITVLRWDVEEIARAVASLLLLQLKKPSSPLPQQVFVQTDLVLRNSCAPPRRQLAKQPEVTECGGAAKADPLP